MKNRVLLGLIICSSLLSCSKNSGSSGEKEIIGNNLETEMYGTYQAILAPLNKSVSGHLNGSLTLVREKDEFVADVRLSGAAPSILHTQTIHIGSRCPNENDDVNLDGFVDGEEAALIHKEILIPLDDDISSQRMGLGTYPASDEYGYYFWSRATSYNKLMEDLREEDLNYHDEYAKLGTEKSLTMTERVVIVRGVPESASLPSTVKAYGRLGNHQALPIACGVIRKLNKSPGIIDTDHTNIPVPDGETIGGSSGVDDGAIFPQTSGGNYGEDDTKVVTHSNEVNPDDH